MDSQKGVNLANPNEQNRIARYMWLRQVQNHIGDNIRLAIINHVIEHCL